MSDIKELVRLEDLAAEYQRIIRDRFNIELNANLEISETKENAFMLATRQPYKISNIKAESLQIVLRFYTICEDRDYYNNTIHLLSQLCGLNKGTFTSNNKTYRYYSFLDFTRPLSEPVVDTGKFYQTLELMGTCLVTQTQGGVLIGNEVETKIKVDIGKETEQEGVIEVLSSNTTLTKTQEAPQMANADTAKGYNNTQAFSYSYTFLLMKNAICERLFKASRGIIPFELNEKVVITETYPPFTGDSNIVDTKNLIITGSQLDRNAGSFMLLNMIFMDELVISNVIDEDTEPTVDYSAGASQAVSQLLAYVNAGGSNTGGGGQSF